MKIPHILAVFSLATAAAPAATVVLTPALYGLGTDLNQDNLVDGFSAVTSGSFRVSLNYTPTSHDVTRSLLHFDLTGLSHVDAAIFEFTAFPTFNASNYNFQTVFSPGDSTVTLSDFNTPGTEIALQPGGPGFSQNLDLTSLINAALTNGMNFVDIRHGIPLPVGGNPNNQSAFIEFASSEQDAQSRPKLTLTLPIPEPTTALSLLLGTAALCARRVATR